MRELIWHSLAMRKVQTVSVVLAVAFSAMTLLALGLIYGGVQQGVAANEQRSGAEAVVVSDAAASTIDDSQLLFSGAPAPIYFPADVALQVAQTEGVKRATVQFFAQSMSGGCCSTKVSTRLIGVDLATDWTVRPFATRQLPDQLGEGVVVLGANVGGQPGDTMRLLKHEFTVFDKLTSSGTDLDNSILMDIGVARQIAAEAQGLSYLWDRYGQPDQLASTVLIDFAEDAARDRVINRITALGGVAVVQRTAVVADAQQSLEAVFAILLGVGLIMLISTVVQLFARFFTCVWDRKSELALYRAIGASAKDLRWLIGAEGIIDVTIGLALGIAAGAGLYQVLLALLTESGAFPFIGLGIGQVLALIAGLVVLFIALTALAIATPLHQIGRVDPSLAMQQGDID